MVTVLNSKKNNILKESLHHLKNGETLLYPSDTIWGLGCDPFNPKAVDTIYNIKQRPKSKSLILLVNSIDMIKRYVKLSETQIRLIDDFDRPTTIIYTQISHLPDYLLHPKDQSIAIRMIHKECFIKDLVTLFDQPITSTSPNLSGEATPNSLSEISEAVLKGVDYIVDLPEEIDPNNKASSILKMNDYGNFDIIRA